MASTDHLLEPWRQALEAINQPGVDAAQRAAFRESWPPAHLPLVPLLEHEATAFSALALLDDGNVIARVGASYEEGHVVLLAGDTAQWVEGVTFFGRCPGRRYFAMATRQGVTVTDGWQGHTIAQMAWPTGLEDLPDEVHASPLEEPPVPTQLIPFPDGQRVLLASSDGIFVLAPQGARRVLPSRQDMAGALARGDMAPEDVPWRLSMEHGAVSPDGRWIAVGCQDGHHRVLDAELQQVASIGPVGEYPHFALFNTRGDKAIFNACHFYNGATLGVAMADLPGLDTDHYADDPRTPTLQNGARVYAGVHRADEFIVGDAHGYLRAFGENGGARWQHFVGSTISAMDVSADGKTLVVATCAGFISFIRLDAGEAAPWQIGTGSHRELHRWLVWRGFDRPMLW
jgi:hypothetical protein